MGDGAVHFRHLYSVCHVMTIFIWFAALWKAKMGIWYIDLSMHCSWCSSTAGESSSSIWMM